MYFIGSILLNIANILLCYNKTDLSVIFFIISSSILFIAVSYDLILKIITKPKTEEFNEVFSLTSTINETKHNNWKKEIGICIYYFIWGFSFLIGAILYLPEMDLKIFATAMVLIGSTTNIIGSVINIDRIVLAKNNSLHRNFTRKQKVAIIILVFFLIGSGNYSIASVLYQINIKAKGLIFLIGSGFYTLGSFGMVVEVISNWESS